MLVGSGNVWMSESLYLWLAVVVSWTCGALWGAYRYECLWRDRSLREILSDLRRAD